MQKILLLVRKGTESCNISILTFEFYLLNYSYPQVQLPQ